jgi:hypothetical protein
MMDHIRTEHGYFSQKMTSECIKIEIQQGKSWLYDTIAKKNLILSDSGLLKSGIGSVGRWSVSIDKDNDRIHVEVKDPRGNMLFVLTDKMEEIQQCT